MSKPLLGSYHSGAYVPGVSVTPASAENLLPSLHQDMDIYNQLCKGVEVLHLVCRSMMQCHRTTMSIINEVSFQKFDDVLEQIERYLGENKRKIRVWIEKDPAFPGTDLDMFSKPLKKLGVKIIWSTFEVNRSLTRDDNVAIDEVMKEFSQPREPFVMVNGKKALTILILALERKGGEKRDYQSDDQMLNYYKNNYHLLIGVDCVMMDYVDSMIPTQF